MPDNADTNIRPMTVPRFVRAKQDGRRLTMLTAYDFLWAQLFDEAGVDSILVGDSLGMVVQGRATTLPVTLDQVIYHAEIVCRAVKHALVVVDLPFMTYEAGPETAMANAGRILKETGASAVKLEGGALQARTIRALSDAGIPVMAHVGLRPQAVRTLGGLGKIQRDADQLLEDARAAEGAGAFSIVLEMVSGSLATKISQALTIPTIGIGSGAGCDGQVLVWTDMLGLTPNFSPRFLKKYADLQSVARQAVGEYVEDVTNGHYPGPEHTHE